MNLLAQNLDQIQKSSGLVMPFDTNNPARIIVTALPYLFGIAGIILVLNIIVAGYQLMTSAGDPKAAQAAQQKITTSIIGIIIIFAAFYIVTLILNFLGINFSIIGGGTKGHR